MTSRACTESAGLMVEVAVITVVSAWPEAPAGTLSVNVTLTAPPLRSVALAGANCTGQPRLEVALRLTVSVTPPVLRSVCVYDTTVSGLLVVR